MKGDQERKALLARLRRNQLLTTSDESANQFDSFQQLEALLSEKIAYWLDYNFQYLVQLMYRLDIDEEHFKKALQARTPSLSIARLILQREIQKVETRIQYSQN